MKTRYWRALVVAIAAGMLLGLLATPAAGKNRNSSSHVTKHEYKAVTVRAASADQATDVLNKAASGGWKLVTVDSGIAYYKRKL